MANEVRIKLTDSQRARIKKATGKDMSEIRVSSVGSNPAVSSSKSISARALRNDNLKNTTARALRVDAAKTAVSARALRADSFKNTSARALRADSFKSTSAKALRSSEDV